MSGLEQILPLVNEAFVAMVDAHDNAQYYEFHYLAGYMEPLKDALETLEQVVINLIDLEKSN